MFYRFLKLTIGTALKFFFRCIDCRNLANVPVNQPLLIVSNHPSAFMDPLVIGLVLKQPLHFLARADVFSSKFEWIIRKANVRPIYRIIDGVESLEKNDAVFNECYSMLANNKTILLFGEGFTDEIFVRRVKSLKKGPLRISFGAENKFDFKLGVKIVCCGINYSDPSKFRSDLFMSFSEPIEVRKYETLFREHNNKAMAALNKEIFETLKQQVIHVEDSSLDELYEQMLVVSKKGIHYQSYDRKISLAERWEFSKRLSEALNQKQITENDYTNSLREKAASYFEVLKKFDLNDDDAAAYAKHKKVNVFSDFISLVYCFPLFLFGIATNYVPYKLPIVVSHSMTKRPVFFSSINMAVGIITFPLCYFLILFFVHFLSANWMTTLAVGILMPFAGLFAFDYYDECRILKSKFRFRKFIQNKKKEIDLIIKTRAEILSKINKLVSEN